jgi:hypothetical protein
MRDYRKSALLAAATSTLLAPLSSRACFYHWSHGLPEPVGIWPTIPSYVPNAAALNAQDAVTNLQAEDALDDAAVNASTGASTGQWEIGNSPVAAPVVSTGNSSIIYGSSALTTNVQPTANPAVSPAVTLVTDPTLTSWQQNTTGYGYSSNSSINSVVSSILVNVQAVAYTSNDVYIKATGVPSYALGPSYGTDPNIPRSQNKTYEINRNPAQSSSGTATSLGAIGIAVNGVSIYNPWDANYYNPSGGTSMTGIWQQNANVVEASTFDSGPGHANQSYDYHYHQSPAALLNQLDPGNTGQHASPLIGFAADGFPIFGPWGYVVNGQGYAVNGSNGLPEVELMTSSYSLRSYTNNVRIDPAAPTVTADDGPNVSSTYPLGYYLQDYYYNAGSGVLNQYNMRYGVAPGYSTPTWAYYVSNSESVNASNGAVTLTPAYPYIIGPNYFGTPDSNDLMRGTVTVPSGVSYFVQGTTADSGSWNVDAAGNWSIVGNWNGAVPAGTDSVATFGPAISASRIVTLSSNQGVGTVNFNSSSSYTIAGTSTLALNVSSGQAIINVIAGSHTISAPLSLLAGTTITVTPASSTLTLSSLQTSSVSLTTAGAGTVAVNTLRLGSLNISSGTVSVLPGATSYSTSKLTGLNIGSGATLNLNNNAMILRGPTLSAVSAWLASGYNGGAWNGSGICSASATGITALGVMLNNNGSGGAIESSFEGQSTVVNDVLVKYTYYGDTNLDGQVTSADYTNIDNGYLQQLTGWSNGDFNYDNLINGSDYTLIDNAFNTQGATISSVIVSPTAAIAAQIDDVASVPEPGAAAFVVAGVIAMLGRRRRMSVVI